MTDQEPLAEGSNPLRSTVFRMFAKAVVGFFVGVVLVDVLVGQLGKGGEPESENALFLRDAELGWTNTPNFDGATAKINSVGLRSREIPADAAPDEVRIALCGASNSFGLGVQNEETWAYQLESILQDDASPSPRILNAAVQGYSIIQSCRRAARIIDTLHPDLVIIVLLPIRQAVMDSSPALQWTRVGQELVPTDLVEDWPASLRSVPANIHKAALHSNLYRRYRTATKFGARVGADVVHFVMSHEQPMAKLVEPMRATLEEIQVLSDYAALMGVELRFALTVETVGASDGKWAAHLANPKHAGAPPVGTPKDEPLDALLDWIRPSGVTIWDLRSVMFEIGADWEQYVIAQNLHWSTKGHQLVAQDLARRIRSDGLLDMLVQRRRESPRVDGPSEGAAK